MSAPVEDYEHRRSTGNAQASMSGQGNDPNYASLPTDVGALHSIINSLQAELRATSSVNTHLAACVARFQAEQAGPTPITTATPTPSTTTTPTPTTTTTTTPITTPISTSIRTPATITTTTITTITTTPAPTDAANAAANGTTATPCHHPNNTSSVPSGRGAGSLDIFNKMIKSNRNGSLGRAHMADIDALPTTVLSELDCYLRRKLRALFPRGGPHTITAAEDIFASLATLGVRLDDRSRYLDYPSQNDDNIRNHSILIRARHISAFFYANLSLTRQGYLRGCAVETLTELARYRGLFDDDGFLTLE